MQQFNFDNLKEVMNPSKFIEQAKSNGHDEQKLDKIWTDWEAFAQYAFNKSHSTCYAFVANQTAYLKANYPSEFMAAVLNSTNNIEDVAFFMEECKRMGLNVLGPDINESLKGFAVNKKGDVRFGLGGLKGVGEAAVDNIIEEKNKILILYLKIVIRYYCFIYNYFRLNSSIPILCHSLE